MSKDKVLPCISPEFSPEYSIYERAGAGSAVYDCIKKIYEVTGRDRGKTKALFIDAAENAFKKDSWFWFEMIFDSMDEEIKNGRRV